MGGMCGLITTPHGSQPHARSFPLLTRLTCLPSRLHCIQSNLLLSERMEKREDTVTFSLDGRLWTAALASSLRMTPSAHSATEAKRLSRSTMILRKKPPEQTILLSLEHCLLAFRTQPLQFWRSVSKCGLSIISLRRATSSVCARTLLGSIARRSISRVQDLRTRISQPSLRSTIEE